MNNNEQKSILEVFGSKSQDGDKVKGLLLNALTRNSYENGGQVPSIDLEDLRESLESPQSPLSGLLTSFGGKTHSDKTIEDVQNILTGKPTMNEVTQIVRDLSRGKEFKDKWMPGWDDPKIGSGGIGGSMQPKPEKGEGLMALLQRVLPGGKTGYKE